MIKPWVYLIAAGLFVVAIAGSIYLRYQSQRVAQFEQSSRSSDAFATGAGDAMNTFGNRVDSERDIDAAVTDAKKDIDNAQNPDDVRRRVLDFVCVRPEYRNNSACTLREPHPR